MAKIEAPQLQRISAIISGDGSISQVDLENRDGKKFSFSVTFRQLGQVTERFHAMGREMMSRLQQHRAVESAEELRAIADAPRSSSVTLGGRLDTGEVVAVFHFDDRAPFSVCLSAPALEQLH